MNIVFCTCKNTGVIGLSIPTHSCREILLENPRDSYTNRFVCNISIIISRDTAITIVMYVRVRTRFCKLVCFYLTKQQQHQFDRDVLGRGVASTCPQFRT